MTSKTPKRSNSKPQRCCTCRQGKPKTERANWQSILEDVNYIR